MAASCKPSPESVAALDILVAAALFDEAAGLKVAAAPLPEGSADDSPGFVLNQ